MPKSDRCEGTDAQGRPCELAPLAGSDYCGRHDKDHLREIGQRGRAKQVEARRRERAAQAQAIALHAADQIRATLEAATREAFAAGDMACVVSACRCALELLKTTVLEARLAALEGKLNARLNPDGKAEPWH